MNKKLRAYLFIGLVACFLTTAVGARWVGDGRPSPQETSAAKQIDNKTQALRVVSVAEGAGVSPTQSSLTITVLNVSSKEVVDYVLTKKDGSTLTTSGATTGWALAPGQADTASVSVTAADHLTLSAVLFEDGEGEGDIQQVARMSGYREGVKKQFQRAVPLLRQADATLKVTESSRAVSVLETLREQLSSLPEEGPEEGVIPEMASGSQHAKQFALRQLKMLKPDPGQTLMQLEKALARMEKSSTRTAKKAR